MRPLAAGSYRYVPGRWYGSPKEVWGFRPLRGRGTPEEIAWEFLEAHRGLLKLAISSLRHRGTRQGLASNHVIFEQRREKLRVHRAYVTVHVDADDRVYLVKNRATPRGMRAPSARARVGHEAALRRAHRSIDGETRSMHAPEKLWFPRDDELVLAWKFRVQCEQPFEEWIVYVSAESGEILNRWDNLASARPWARVFDPNPAVALGGPRGLLRANRDVLPPPERSYRRVRLEGLPEAGTLDGPRVTTKWTAEPRARVEQLAKAYPARSHRFEEVMTYYHLDRALRSLEDMGYRGERALFSAPLEVDAHGTRAENAWYSPEDRRLIFGTGGVDAAEDAEVILHEFGHAIQDAIVPDFGQSKQAAAMGEGFGDYWAASTFAGRKRGAARKYLPCVMSWWGIQADHDEDEPPCERRVDSPETFESFDPDGDEHDNGTIWSAVLWEVRAALGRKRADAAIVESHFQLDGFTTFARGARAILDANRNLNGGFRQRNLEQIFVRRGIGPVA